MEEDTRTLEELVANINDVELPQIKSDLAGINTKLADVNTKLASILSHVTEIEGHVPDIRAEVTDVKIERIYIGDREDRREKSEAMIADLLNAGYRPYVFLGQNEDLARYAFAKYTGANAPVNS